MSRPIKGLSYTLYVGLVSRSTGQLQANPTLASGDVQISKDGGAFANITTLPTVSPASGRSVQVSLSATEMAADSIVIQFVDAAGAEWNDLFVDLQTDGVLTGFEVDDAVATPTTTVFRTSLTEATDDHFNDMFAHFISGNLQGQSRKISDYDGTNKEITLATALTEAPADGDKAIIVGRSE